MQLNKGSFKKSVTLKMACFDPTPTTSLPYVTLNHFFSNPLWPVSLYGKLWHETKKDFFVNMTA